MDTQYSDYGRRAAEDYANRVREAAKARRERIATAALVGLLASPATDDDVAEEMAEKALMFTDALIEALDE